MLVWYCILLCHRMEPHATSVRRLVSHRLVCLRASVWVKSCFDLIQAESNAIPVWFSLSHTVVWLAQFESNGMSTWLSLSQMLFCFDSNWVNCNSDLTQFESNCVFIDGVWVKLNFDVASLGSNKTSPWLSLGQLFLLFDLVWVRWAFDLIPFESDRNFVWLKLSQIKNHSTRTVSDHNTFDSTWAKSAIPFDPNWGKHVERKAHITIPHAWWPQGFGGLGCGGIPPTQQYQISFWWGRRSRVWRKVNITIIHSLFLVGFGCLGCGGISPTQQHQISLRRVGPSPTHWVACTRNLDVVFLHPFRRIIYSIPHIPHSWDKYHALLSGHHVFVDCIVAQWNCARPESNERCDPLYAAHNVHFPGVAVAQLVSYFGLVCASSVWAWLPVSCPTI